MSLRKLLIVRGLVAVLMTVFAIIAFAGGRTFTGVLLSAFVIVNVGFIVVLIRRQQ
jgi:hypothetical protein